MKQLISILSLATMIGACSLRSAPQKPASPPMQNKGATHTAVLIYGGPGSWGDEIDSLKEILYAHGITYDELDDDDFNETSEDEFASYSLVIFPGGDSDDVTAKLSLDTRRRLRRAVIDRGLNYLGFCAGAWLVVSPEAELTETSYGFQLVTGPWLAQTPYHNEGLSQAVVVSSLPDGTKRKLLWFGGPITPNVPNGVIAKYPDGNPAITQMKAGKGFVILSGLHPTVNKKTLAKINLFEKEVIAPELGWTMLNSALNGTPMTAFP